MGVDDDITVELARVEGERLRLATELEARRTAEHARLEVLERQQRALVDARAALDTTTAAALARVQEMDSRRRVVLSGRKRVLKALQQLVRGVLALITMLALLLLPGVFGLGGGAIMLLVLADAGATWFLGDLADYLELSGD